MKPGTLFLLAILTLLLVGLLCIVIIPRPIQGWVPRARIVSAPLTRTTPSPTPKPDPTLKQAVERVLIPLRVAVIITGRLNLNVEQLRNFRFAFGHDSTKQLEIYASSSCQDAHVIEAFSELYQIKGFSKNDAPSLDVTRFLDQKAPEANVRNCLAMYWNRERALSLLSTLEQDYDVVISTRADLFFQQQVHLEDYWPEIQKGSIFVPEGLDYGGLNDQFAIGRPQEMIKYLNVYSHIETLLESGVALHPESLLLAHVQSEQITAYRQPLSFRIHRMPEVYY